MTQTPIEFIDLKAQRDFIRKNIDVAIASVVDHGNFIMGPEVQQFENALADFCGAKFALGCANGTDALQLVLMAEEIGKNDAVFVPAFTFVATAECIPLLGATPVFVDVLPDTFNMDPTSLEDAIVMCKKQGLNPKAIIPVDLFGQPADYHSINSLAEKYKLIVIADAAQGLGGTLDGKPVGSLATWTTTSFFPAKPLGCYGDGGAVMTDDEERANLVKSLRIHGKGSQKYDNVRVGLNSRLDTIQAAILIEKLKIFPNELLARDRIAKNYTENLRDVIFTPNVINGGFSSWAQYTLRTQSRDKVQNTLKEAGVPSVVYYPKPLNKQTGYSESLLAPGGVPVSEGLSSEVLSIPMHPYLTKELQDFIIEIVISATEN